MLKPIALLSLTLVASLASAAGPSAYRSSTTGDFERHEILLNGTSVVVALTPGTTGALGFSLGSGGTLIGGGFAYNYGLASFLQLGLFPSVVHISSGSSSATLLTAIAGPTLNLFIDDKLDNAFFITAAAGITHSTAGSSTNFTFRGEIGKRFSLLPHVVYRPSAGILKIGSADPFLIFNLLGGSFLF